MKYRKFGNTGMRVSEISLGSMFFGGAQYRATDNPVSKEDALAVIKKALELDINHLDCADIYGAYGNAEEILGEAIKEYDRDHLLISSKVMLPMSRNEFDRGLSRKHIRKSIGQTLDRLQTEYIDIYYCHRYDYLTPLHETISTMNNLIDEGLIHSWGTSNWSPAELERAMSICNHHGYQPPVIDQTKYNINRRYPVEVALPYTLDFHSIGISAYKILAEGIFTGMYYGKSLEELSDQEKRSLTGELPQTNQRLTQEYLHTLDKFVELARNNEITPSQLAYAWVLRRPEVSTAITSSRNPDRIAENAEAVDISISKDVIEEINSLFPVESSYYATYSYINQNVEFPRIPGKIAEDQMRF